MVIGLPETGEGSVAGDPPDRLRELAQAAEAIAVGPGLDDVDETGALLRNVLDAAGPRAAVVLDAYALGALSHDRELVTGQARPAVLTRPISG